MKQIDDLIKQYEASLKIVSEAAENAGDEKDRLYMRDKKVTIKKFIMSLENLKKSLKQPKRLQHRYEIIFTKGDSKKPEKEVFVAETDTAALGMLYNNYKNECVSWQTIKKLKDA